MGVLGGLIGTVAKPLVEVGTNAVGDLLKDGLENIGTKDKVQENNNGDGALGLGGENPIMDLIEDFVEGLIDKKTRPQPQQSAPALPQPAPALPQSAPALPQSAPALPQSAPALQQPAPALPQSAPALQQPAAALPQSASVLQQPAAALPQSAPVVPTASPQSAPVVPTASSQSTPVLHSGSLQSAPEAAALPQSSSISPALVEAVVDALTNILGINKPDVPNTGNPNVPNAGNNSGDVESPINIFTDQVRI